MFGPFHHFAKSVEDLESIRRTSQLCGRAPNGSNVPQVQAYSGRAPPGRVNVVTFETSVAPKPDTAPYDLRWHPDWPGVVLEDGYAKIPIRIIAIA